MKILLKFNKKYNKILHKNKFRNKHLNINLIGRKNNEAWKDYIKVKKQYFSSLTARLRRARRADSW